MFFISSVNNFLFVKNTVFHSQDQFVVTTNLAEFERTGMTELANLTVLSGRCSRELCLPFVSIEKLCTKNFDLNNLFTLSYHVDSTNGAFLCFFMTIIMAESVNII